MEGAVRAELFRLQYALGLTNIAPMDPNELLGRAIAILELKKYNNHQLDFDGQKSDDRSSNGSDQLTYDSKMHTRDNTRTPPPKQREQRFFFPNDDDEQKLTEKDKDKEEERGTQVEKSSMKPWEQLAWSVLADEVDYDVEMKNM